MKHEALIQMLRQLNPDLPADIDFAPDSDYVKGPIEPKYSNDLLEVRARLEPIEPALEISTYGMTIAINTGAAGHLEGRSFGYPYAKSLDAGAGLWLKLPSGAYRASYIVAGYVKLADQHYSGWLKQGVHDFRVP